MALCQCIQEFWRTHGESEEVALVKSDGTERKEVTYVELSQWQKELRMALGGDEWLIIGINLTPFSIEETMTMLLVAEGRAWSYVPIDMELPLSRQLSMLQSAGIRRLVTTAESPLAKYFGKEMKARAIEMTSSSFRPVQVVNLPDSFLKNSEVECMGRRLREEESFVAPLYVLFTSGTTGEPRGVMGTRTGAWTRLEWMWTAYPFIKSERVLRATKLSFVDSVWEILGAFLKRVSLVHFQPPESVQRSMRSVVLDNSARFLEVIRSENVTRFTAVPSVLEVLLLQTTEKDRKSALSGLRYVLSSGESLRLHVVQQLTANLPGVTILNLYGSTELSGDVTCMELKAPFSSAQIALWQEYGIPIANLDRYGVVGSVTALLLLPHDRDNSAHDSTVVWPTRSTACSEYTEEPTRGILYVSGSLLTFGYVGDEDAFVNSDKLLGHEVDTEPARRWFCTGDICCVIQGHLYYCGRKDNAVKIHGQRVYLEAVERAVAAARKEIEKDTHFGEDHQVVAITSTKEVSKYALIQQHIVAFIICDDANNTVTRHPQTKTLNVWISERFGAFHAPFDVLLLPSKSVPRLAHGKIDRRSLEKFLDYDKNDNAHSLAISSKGDRSTEVVVAQSLEEILGVSLSTCIFKDIRARTFADMGGNSLLATLFLHELRQVFGTLSIAAQDLLEMTIDEILSAVNAQPKKHHPQKPTTEILQRSMKPRSRTTEEPSDDIKRRKRTHHTHQQGRLNFISRYNQSSMGVNSIYLPACYFSQSRSLSWELRCAWRVDLSKCIDASPLVVQRRDHNGVLSTWAIVGSHSGQLVCVDVLAAGREIWRVTLDDRIEACAALNVKHEIVYVGTYRGTLFALDLQSGRTRWTFQAKGTIKASALVIEEHELVAFGAYDNNLYGLDVVTGQLQWILDVRGSIFSTPLYCNWPKQIFVASTNGNVMAIMSTSDDSFKSIKENWRLQLPLPVFAGLNTDYESNILLAGCADGKLYGVNMTTGDIQWQLATDKPIFSSPCVYQPGSVVFGSHDGMLRKVNSRTGELVWATNLNGAVFASPTVVRLIAEDATNQDSDLVCCVTTTTGQLCFCNERTGSIIYQTSDSSGEALSDANSAESNDLGPLFGSPVLIDNWCLLGTRTNYFYGFEMVSTTF
ncbi:hypothetical protein L917_18919 [Phytophthora nicotianae]|uniref:Carrier domain-containing protein n=1 Tax=Phytophthora nicotianae TaxID=4792 RepID=W2K7V2_PHYNI|nr:hypothetical protein L917_18919 [Phytophthora nicotianae]